VTLASAMITAVGLVLTYLFLSETLHKKNESIEMEQLVQSDPQSVSKVSERGDDAEELNIIAPSNEETTFKCQFRI